MVDASRDAEKFHNPYPVLQDYLGKQEIKKKASYKRIER
jgi:hypothetical protein